MKILLDTNFLLIPGKFRVDIFTELQKFVKPQLYTLDLVLKELEKIAKGKGRDAGNARLALGLIKEKGIKILKTKDKNTDSEIERLAVEGDYIVCTQDKRLIERLKKENIQIIYLRQKKYLEYWAT